MRSKYLVETKQASIQTIDTVIKEVITKQKDIDTTTITLKFENGLSYTKNFKVQSTINFSLQEKLKNLKKGQQITLILKAGMVVEVRS